MRPEFPSSPKAVLNIGSPDFLARVAELRNTAGTSTMERLLAYDCDTVINLCATGAHPRHLTTAWKLAEMMPVDPRFTTA